MHDIFTKVTFKDQNGKLFGIYFTSRRNKHHNERSKNFKLILENIKDYHYELSKIKTKNLLLNN